MIDIKHQAPWINGNFIVIYLFQKPRPINLESLACPARFGRATYAFEEFATAQTLINSVTYSVKMVLLNKLCDAVWSLN
jgi:hypothetical protein